MKVNKYLLSTALVLSVGASACRSSTPRRVVRTGAQSTAGGDLSGYWNDIDAQQTAKAMIQDCLSHRWISDHQSRQAGERPVIKLMGVLKRTDDRNVNEQYFSKQLERQLLNSGQVRVVASFGQSNVNVVERARQSTHADDDSAKSQGSELGADYTLQTIVNSQNETDGGGKSVRAYMVNMELVNVETNEKVWIGEKQIRKVVTQKGVTW